MRRCTFAPHSFTPKTAAGVRRIGAPYKEFAPTMLKHTIGIFGDVQTAVAAAAQSKAGWTHIVRQHILGVPAA